MLLIWLQRALFSALPPGLYLIYPNRRCLCFPPCNHSYINNSKYFSDCSASFSSSCLFSACSPAKTTNWTRVGCGWGQRQAAAVCSFPLFFVFLFSLSLGKIQGMDHCWFHHDAERTDITFQTMTALWSLTGSAKVLMLSSDTSFFPVPAGDCSWQQIFWQSDSVCYLCWTKPLNNMTGRSGKQICYFKA